MDMDTWTLTNKRNFTNRIRVDNQDPMIHVQTSVFS